MILHAWRSEIHIFGNLLFMGIGSITGTTDTISSIALVGCCILSSMVLISSLSYSFGERGALQLRILTENGEALFHEFIKSVSDIGLDGVRYLRNDWPNVMDEFAIDENCSCTISCTMSIRIFHQPEYVVTINGDPMRCPLMKRFAAPALLLTGHSCLPVELSMVVGM